MTETRGEQLQRQSRVLRKIAPYTHVVPPEYQALADGPCKVSWADPAIGGSRSFGYDRLLSLTVKRGREGPGEQPATGTLTFAFVVRDPAELDALQPGHAVTFAVLSPFGRYLFDLPVGTPIYDQNAYQNSFRSFVTDASLSYVTQGEGRPPLPVANVVCQGPRGRGAQVRIGDTPWPQESLSGRLTKITGNTKDALLKRTGEFKHTDASLTWNGFILNSPGVAATYLITARDVDRQPPDGLLDELAADVGAVWGDSLRRPGIVWQGIDARGDRDPLVELTADEIAQTATWGRRLAGTVNRYTIETGPEGARVTTTVEDPNSIDQVGEFGVSRSSQLADANNGAQLAGLIVGRNSKPSWSITRLDVDLLDLKLPKAKAALLLLAAEYGALIHVTGLPSTAPASTYLIVEGTELTFTRHDVRMAVYVSEASRTGAPLPWEDVPAELTWADVDPTLSWLQAAGWYVPPPLIYRWADVPADQRWSHLAEGETREPSGDARVPTWESYPNDPA